MKQAPPIPDLEVSVEPTIGEAGTNLVDWCVAVVWGPSHQSKIVQEVEDHFCKADVLLVGLEVHLWGSAQPPHLLHPTEVSPMSAS